MYLLLAFSAAVAALAVLAAAADSHAAAQAPLAQLDRVISREDDSHLPARVRACGGGKSSGLARMFIRFRQMSMSKCLKISGKCLDMTSDILVIRSRQMSDIDIK